MAATFPPLRASLSHGPSRAELLAFLWEIFSATLFISAVVPAAFKTPWPASLFLVSLALSAALAPVLLARGNAGFSMASLLRTFAWPLCVVPLFEKTGWRGLVAAFAFGLMAGGMRRAIYRRFADKSAREVDDYELAMSLRARLSESAMMAGIAGGHVMLLFSVAFLRTQSPVVFRAWFEIVPVLALLGTAGFTMAVRPSTRWILDALKQIQSGDRALLERGLEQTIALPGRLSNLNFGLWFVCTAIGVISMQTSATNFAPGDVAMQLAFGGLFSWGVAFYQRAWHRDTMRVVEERLRRALGTPRAMEAMTVRTRMLRDFGFPLLFTAMLSLLASIALYRSLGGGLGFQEDLNAITALFTSFSLLLLAAGGVVVRAALELSRPMTELAEAADHVARGQLDAAVPPVFGPAEVMGLGASVERMRQALGRTIAELEEERAGLERNVDARTAELKHALEELRRTQAALIQGERLASIGELVAGVAHEIVNPLNAIAGASVPLEALVHDLRRMIDAYVAVEKDLPPARRAELEALRREIDLDASLDDLVGISTVVKRATDRSVRIVQNLRNFSRVSGDLTPSDLHAGVEETLMLLAPRLRQASIQVVKELGALPEVRCRAGEINQVFMNLLVNAIQSLEGDKARDPSLEPEIRIETRVEEDCAVVSFADNGPGVPGDLQKRIFDPFFTTKPRGQGTGLGLSISSDILRRHGGSLTLERLSPRGAKFILRLPFHEGTPQARLSSGSLPAGGPQVRS